MNLLALALLCIAFGGCSPRYADFFPYYDNGTKKPFLTLLPAYNSVPGEDAFTEQLGKQIRNRLKRRGKIYCPPLELADRVLTTVSLNELAHTSNLALFQKFQGSDYVCLIELTEYKTVPYKRNTITPLYIASLPDDAAKVLMIAARLNIVDIRGPVPKFVRQEIVQSNHMVPFDFPLDSNGVNLNMVRSRFARDLEQKIEQTVCVKK